MAVLYSRLHTKIGDLMPNPTITWTTDGADPNVQWGSINNVKWYKIAKLPGDLFNPAVRWALYTGVPNSSDVPATIVVPAPAIYASLVEADVKQYAVNELVKFVTLVRNTMGLLGLIGGLL